MLKEAVASKAAKLLMTCVCPVAGTTALSLGVPKVRDAVHKAVQPRQYAKPKTRVRQQQEEAVEVAANDPCPAVTPFALSDLPLPTTNPLTNGPVELAEAPSPDKSVPLTSRIFVPPSGATLPSEDGLASSPFSESGTSLWVQLVLGFGLVGVPRVTYRKNGAQPEADPQDA